MNSISGPKSLVESSAATQCSEGLITTAIYMIRTRDTKESIKALMKAHSPSQCVLFPFCSFHCIVCWLYTFTSPSFESQSSLDCSTHGKFLGLVLLDQGLKGTEGTSWLLSSKKNVIQKLLGQVNLTYMYSHANTHFCIEILFEVFLIPKLAV